MGWTLNPSRRALAYWLIACSALVFATTVVGGITRLTHSGLSIVEWRPLVGAVPPLSPSDWEELFAKYQRTPEFQKVNRDMTLGGFKFIFWWEWVHRLLGRAIGVVFVLPLVWFLARGQVDRARLRVLAVLFGLGCLQGAMGWYMVKSGLVDDPRVSQYRLTAHLGLGFVIFGVMWWTALDLLRSRSRRPAADGDLRGFAAAVAALSFVMVLTGGLVAGLRAGQAFNTFPLMDGSLVPASMWWLDPWWMNFFGNVATVQFDHRLLAWVLIGVVPALWLWATVTRAPRRARVASAALVGWLAVQVGLGIATLLLAVPVPLAAAHQAGALVFFALVLWVNHELRAC